MKRCEAHTWRGDPCWWVPAAEVDGVTLCDAHWRVLRSGKAIRIGDGLQARIAHDITGRHPRLRVAAVETNEQPKEHVA